MAEEEDHRQRNGQRQMQRQRERHRVGDQVRQITHHGGRRALCRGSLLDTSWEPLLGEQTAAVDNLNGEQNRAVERTDKSQAVQPAGASGVGVGESVGCG